jgi:uracil phosphoribosyltransferase
MKNLTVVKNPLVLRDLTILRNKRTEEYDFRLALKRISYCLVTEISNEFELSESTVETPLETAVGYTLKKQIVLIPVLRAGLSMVSAFIEMIPNAKVGHIGLQRDEETLKPVDYYYKTPKNLEVSKVLVLDPMLATGGSASAAITYLKEKGAQDCMLACLIAAPEGVAKMAEDHPDVKVFTRFRRCR